MRDRADALDGMVERGQLTDQSDPRTATQRELAVMRATTAVDDELARLKAAAPKAIEPPR